MVVALEHFENTRAISKALCTGILLELTASAGEREGADGRGAAGKGVGRLGHLDEAAGS